MLLSTDKDLYTKMFLADLFIIETYERQWACLIMDAG